MKNLKFWEKKKAAGTAPVNGMSVGSKKSSILKGLGLTGVGLVVVVGIVGVVGYIFLVKPAYVLISSAKALKADVSDIGSSLSSRDLVTLEEDLVQFEKDLNKLREDRENNFGWAKDLKILQINEFYEDSDRFINAAFYSVDALREISVVVTPFADAAGLKVSPDQEVVTDEGLMEAFQNWVSIMPEVAGKMDGVIVKVSMIGDELEPINVDKYPEKIKGVYVRDNIAFVKNTLSRADEYAPDIKEALILFPRVLGINSPQKRYMIIMQNDKELRPTGGFMTNYATFKINNAMLQSDFTSKDMYSVDYALDLIDAYTDFPDAPAAYTKYLDVERWYARDMNYSPDFVDSMDQFMKFYNWAGRIMPSEIKPVDGIFAINTNVIKELLEVTGPVTVNGITYSPENVVIELEKIASLQMQEQVNRKKVLGDLMEAMLVNVFEADKNLWPKLIEKGADLAVRKEVLVYLFDPEAQVLVEKYNFAGRINEDVVGDYAMAVSTNLGGDKTNWFTAKEITHDLSREGDRWMRTTSIQYTYEEPKGDYALFAKRFRDWMRFYVPLGSEFISVDGSEDGTVEDQERGKTYFTGYVELAPGESKTMVFKYYLPVDVEITDKYDLTIQKQAGVGTELHKVSVNGSVKEEVELVTDTEVMVRL